MIKVINTAFLLCVALITTACTNAMKTPELKQNPNPKQRYEVTMSIQDAPGPFDSVTGYVLYKVQNDLCVPISPGIGARMPPYTKEPLQLKRAGDLYVGEFYADRMLDEDYYGLGLCKWAITVATVQLKARTNIFDATFYGSPDKIVPEKPLTLYFFSTIYTDPKIENYRDEGGARDPRHQQFSITISTKENFK